MCGPYYRKKGLKPNAFTYSALISVLAEWREWDRALAILDVMKREAEKDASCAPNGKTYAKLIAGCEEEGRVDTVFDLYEEMLAMGLESDRLTMVCVLGASMQRGEWDKAKRMLDELHGRGMPAAPETYDRFIMNCSGRGAWNEALDVFLNMQLVGITPSAYTCAALMRVAETTNRADMGLDLLNEMREGSIPVNSDAFNALLRALARAGDWEQTLRLVMSMEGQAVRIDGPTSEVVVRQCMEAGELELASDLSAKFHLMNMDGDSQQKGMQAGLDAGYSPYGPSVDGSWRSGSGMSYSTTTTIRSRRERESARSFSSSLSGEDRMFHTVTAPPTHMCENLGM